MENIAGEAYNDGQLANGDSFLEALSRKAQPRQSPGDFIPPVPDNYCFADENFLSDTFSVDGFVKRNTKRIGSLEKMKEDLAAYQRILKHSMVELINVDYSEFINLASNLVSFEKSIDNIKKPIVKFHDETNQVQTRIDEVIALLCSKQNRIKQIQDNKLRLNMTLEILQFLHRVEDNVQAIKIRYPNETKRDQLYYLMLDETATLASRMQTNFDHLSENADSNDKNNTLSLVMKLRQKFKELSMEISLILDEEVIRLLTFDFTLLTSEEHLNVHITRIESLFVLFLLNGQQKQLEKVIKERLVRPQFDAIVNDTYITRHGVKSLFEQVNKFIDTQCVLLIKVLTSSATLSASRPTSFGESCDLSDNDRLSRFGYELLIGAIWTELVQCLVVRCSSLYTLANVDTFHQNYMITFRFVDEFLCKTCLVDYRSAFQRLPAYQMLKEKFNLNVYFFMRLQQIAPKLEKSFTEFGYSATNKTGGFKLNITQAVFDNIVTLWCSDTNNRTHFGDLFAHLWKLTLKVNARFTIWLRKVSLQSLAEYHKPQEGVPDVNQNRRIIHQILCKLVFDADLFTNKLSELFRSIIVPVWIGYLDNLRPLLDESSAAITKKNMEARSLEASFNESMAFFRAMALANLTQILHKEISEECVAILNLVNDIPRLYRRTNKEKPTRASTYILNCFTKLAEFRHLIGFETQPTWLTEWFTELIIELTNFYRNATLEVLTSVQKTEDSLKKLKKAKPNAQQFRTSDRTMSDDDKIRLLIYFDVQEFGVEMQSKMGIKVDSVKPYQELASMVSSLKILA